MNNVLLVLDVLAYIVNCILGAIVIVMLFDLMWKTATQT